MNVSNEQYSDVSCFRKRETRVLLIARVHAYWEEIKAEFLTVEQRGELYMALSQELCAEY